MSVPRSATAPVVSVVIPTYRREGRIAEVLRSVLAQTVTDLEVIVVDDCSGDDTEQVVNALGDPRIRYVAHEQNRGANAARASGIAVSRGRYVAFLDSDDTWRADKLERQLSLLRAKGDGYGFCTTWFAMIAPSGEVRHCVEPRLDGHDLADLLVANWLGGYSTLVVERALLAAVGGPDPSLKACQDWDLYLRLNRISGVCVVPEHLVDYRFDPDDPVRISTRRRSVLTGQRHIYAQVRPRLAEVSAWYRIQSRRALMQGFANLGAVTDVVGVVRDVPRASWTPELAGYAAHMVARAVRKRFVLGERTAE